MWKKIVIDRPQYRLESLYAFSIKLAKPMNFAKRVKSANAMEEDPTLWATSESGRTKEPPPIFHFGILKKQGIQIINIQRNAR
jgi:hypothetical protein